MKIRVNETIYNVEYTDWDRFDECYYYYVEGQDEPFNDLDDFVEIVEYDK